jgi:transposase
MSMSELKHVSEGPRRFDVFTGAGRRRSFTAAEKAAIVEESYAGADSVCGVARRHGLTPQQLFGWRRLARPQPSRPAERPLFVPVIVSPEPEPMSKGGRLVGQGARGKRRRTSGASIELEVGGVVVRVGRDADAGAIAAVIGALRASS